MIGYQSSIHSIGHNYKENNFPVFKSAVKLDSDVVIFSHCFIGPGVHLKDGCTLLPATTVFKGVYDEKSTLIGNPSKVISKNGDVKRGEQFHNSPFGF
jgi:acetyltransferase-like isoleucine patch superfamily enzyme